MMATRVIAALIFRAGGVLATRRAPGQRHAGLWEFPGGKREPGETDESCLARELREELGIEGETGAFVCESVYRYPEGEIRLRAYAFDWRAGDLALSVHDEALFADADALDNLAFTPADLPLKRAAAAMLRGDAASDSASKGGTKPC